jgi:primase-polymerase (primpol)-like protein
MMLNENCKSAINNPNSEVLRVMPENIPEVLITSDNWLVWSYKQPKGQNKKWRKVPMSSNGGAGRVNDPSTWATFEKALSVYESGKADGIGFVLGDDLHGIDLDNCRDPATGELNQLAHEVLSRIQGYAEVSPSGTGIKLVAKTNLLQSKANSQIELYNGRRYFCLTGHWHSPKSVDKYDVKTEMENCKCNERNMPLSSKTRQSNKSSIKATRLSM